MTMRLRENIRPPQRLADELSYLDPELSSLSLRRSFRAATHTARHRFVGFNPNLPPAAFPSLLTPRRATETHSQGSSNRNVESNVAAGIQQPSQGQSLDRSFFRGDLFITDKIHVDLSEIPIDLVDNYAASNGNQNETYVRNMAIMASYDSSDEGLQCSGSENGDDANDDSGTKKEIKPCPSDEHAIQLLRPEWKDLSLKLRVEIFSNLLKTYSCIDIPPKLGLTRQESTEIYEEMKDQFDYYNWQVETENNLLAEMRAKQLRVLLRLNNSERKSHCVPHQLVFRKISRQQTRKLRERVPNDYLMCQAGEILNARRFLQRLGLDPKYAGDWSNRLVTLRTPDDARELAEHFEWQDLSQAELESLLDTDSIGTSPQGYDSSHDSDHTPSRIEKIVRLKVRTPRTAPVQDLLQSGCIPPRQMHIQIPPEVTSMPPPPLPPPSASIGSRPKGATVRSMIPQKRQRSRDAEEPVKRVLGGIWSYDSVAQRQHTQIVPAFPTTASMKLRQKLEDARAEGQRLKERERIQEIIGAAAVSPQQRHMPSKATSEVSTFSNLPSQELYDDPDYSPPSSAHSDFQF